MARSPRPLGSIFERDATVAGWTARRRRDESLQDLLRRELPRQLADRLRIADATGSELLLSADVGAVAAMVRQRAPDLVAALRRGGWEFAAIRVRVRVRTVPMSGRTTAVVQPDRGSLRALAELARALPVGSPLKAALTRFVRKVGD